MSFCLTLSSLSKNKRKEILRKCSLKSKSTMYNTSPAPVRCFNVDRDTDTLYLPLGLWKSYSDDFPNGEKKDFPKMNKNVKFTGKLLTAETDPSERNRDQDIVAKTALRHLKNNNSVFISCFTGFGKTALAIYLSLVLGLKTLIICDIDLVKDQWPDEYSKYTKGGAKIKCQKIIGKITQLDPNADVYIVGIQKSTRLDFDLTSIGTVIIDEAHLSTVTAFTNSLLNFQPMYLIGLSATPDRKDGLDSLFNLYFGEKKNFVVRMEHKDFTVYKYQTGIIPDIEYKMFQGRMIPNWDVITKSIEHNEDKWKLVADVACEPEFADEKIMILCKLNASLNGIYSILEKREEYVAKLSGTTKKWDKNARILVAGFKKAGVGFNDPELTMIIIASDTTDIRQFEGRCRTTDNIIYHFVDYYSSFEKHWNDANCRGHYLRKGADIIVLGEEHIYDTKVKKMTTKRLGK
jgi:superfamily II DNA or RNA helicase